jgi:hypothetical protein
MAGKKNSPISRAEQEHITKVQQERKIEEYGGFMADALTKLDAATEFVKDGAPLDAARAANMAIVALFAAYQKRMEVLGA